MFISATINEITREIKWDKSQVAAVDGDYAVNGFKLTCLGLDPDYNLTTGTWYAVFTAQDGTSHSNPLTVSGGVVTWEFDNNINKGGSGVVKFFLYAVTTNTTGKILKRWDSAVTDLRVAGTIDYENQEEEAARESEIDRLAGLVTTLTATAATINDVKAVISRITNSSPVVVAAVADLSGLDTTKYQLAIVRADGYLYYYDGAAWQQGIKYGSYELDTTLTESGKAADAAAVGAAVTEIKEDLSLKLDAQQSVDDAGKFLGINSEGNVVPQAVRTDIEDNSITYAMLQKDDAVELIAGTVVDFWFYNKNKRTDGQSIEYQLEPYNIYKFMRFDSGLGNILYTDIDGTISRENPTTIDGETFFRPTVECKLYLLHYAYNTTYYSNDYKIYNLAPVSPPINLFGKDWNPEVMSVAERSARRVDYALRWYSSSGAEQSFNKDVVTYYTPYIGWYKVKDPSTVIMLDENWAFLRAQINTGYFYNDGTCKYVQGGGISNDITPVLVGTGITEIANHKIVSIGDAEDVNKLRGKSVVCFGDSITWTGYPKKLMGLTNCIAINMGKSGARSNHIKRNVTGIGEGSGEQFNWDSNPVDMAILMVGYNDTYRGTVEEDIPTTTVADFDGDWSLYADQFNASNPTSGTTIGNLAFMVEWLQANKPDVRILIANYHNNNDANSSTRTIRCDEAAQAVSELYGVQLLDVRRTSGINKKNAATYTTDGLHPNDAGQEMIAKAILRQM